MVDTVHELVLQQGASRPEAIAVIHGEQQTSYRELIAISAAYAAEMAGRGVRKGDIIPVAIPRSLRLVGVILGILRLGAAYSLIDTAWPTGRIRDIVGQLNASLLVADDDLTRSAIPVWIPGPPRAAEVPCGDVDVSPQDPCCVFFTSGTTGRPKGAISPHSGTTRLTDGDSLFVDFGPHTVMPSTSALPWDPFSLELWAPLMSGGTTVLIDDPFLSGPLLRELIARDGVNTIWATASVFNMLVDNDLDCFQKLDVIILGGERLSPSHARTFLIAYPNIQLINAFGPVETTIFCSAHTIKVSDCDLNDGIPVGVPLPRTKIYVLDGTRVCSDGEMGELCVAGEGIALGYLGNDALTRQKFPTLRLEGRDVRVCRTGDLGFRDEGGTLHFQGRADRQVKVRGMRMELEEIESIVTSLPGVGRCIVLPRAAHSGQYVGVDACYTTSPGACPEPEWVLEELRKLVPRFSVPDLLIRVDSIPLTANGKLDESAVRDLLSAAAPAIATASPSGDDFLHEGPIRSAVANAFASVVRIAPEQIDPDLTLVQLGGTSLDAARVSALIADSLGRPVPLSQVFRAPTIRGLADELALVPADGTAPESAQDILHAPLSSTQRMMLGEHLVNPDGLDRHCVIAWRIEGRPDRAALRAAFSYVHDRHKLLSSCYDLAAVATATPSGKPFPGLTEVLVETEQDAKTILDQELGRPFRLQEGYAWRAIFVAVRQVHVTLIGVSVHHIAFDGTSASVLADDLSHAYNAYRVGRVPDQPSATGPAQIAAMRDSQARYTELAPQREYWRQVLDGIPPFNYPDDAECTSPQPSKVVQMPLSADLIARLKNFARQHATTVFVAYLSAFQQTLAELACEEDFGIGTPVSQRDSSTLSAAVGYLINIICLRLRTSPQESPSAAIIHTAQEVTKAFAAQDVPFNEVVELQRYRGDETRPPLCQHYFALQDHQPAELDLAGLRAEFFLPGYPDVPNEVFTEIWPISDGGAQLVIHYRPHCTSADFCQQLAATYLGRLARYAAEG